MGGSAAIDMAASIRRLRWLAETPAVAAVAERFAAAGHELALVGGPVRDAFLDRSATDLDLTTDARPDRILELVEPLAEAHWDIGRAFGTIGARIGGRMLEITTWRTDRYDPESRKPEVAFGDSLEADLSRRDFAVNAMALALRPGVEPRLIDPWGGVDDLLAGRLRTPAAPEISFGEDPLRMLRAARFTAQLGFQVAENARSAMTAMAERISIVSAERVGAELRRLVLASTPVPALRLLVDTGLAQLVLPELPALRLEIDEHARHKDVYEHTLTVIEQAIDLERSRGHAPDVVLRLAALLHDIGKPATRRIEPGGAVSFHHHDVVGAKLAAARLRALRFPSEVVKPVVELIRLHLRFFGYTDGAWTDSAVRRYVRDAGDQLERLHILVRADVTTRNVRRADRLSFAYDDLEQRVAALAAEEELAAIRPDLDGEAIMRILGIRPGREVGEAYRMLLDARLDEGPLGQGEAERRLRAWWAARR